MFIARRCHNVLKSLGSLQWVSPGIPNLKCLSQETMYQLLAVNIYSLSFILDFITSQHLQDLFLLAMGA